MKWANTFIPKLYRIFKWSLIRGIDGFNDEPLSMTAFWNKPFDAGEIKCKLMLIAPVFQTNKSRATKWMVKLWKHKRFIFLSHYFVLNVCFHRINGNAMRCIEIKLSAQTHLHNNAWCHFDNGPMAYNLEFKH